MTCSDQMAETRVTFQKAPLGPLTAGGGLGQPRPGRPGERERGGGGTARGTRTERHHTKARVTFCTGAARTPLRAAWPARSATASARSGDAPSRLADTLGSRGRGHTRRAGPGVGGGVEMPPSCTRCPRGPRAGGQRASSWNSRHLRARWGLAGTLPTGAARTTEGHVEPSPRSADRGYRPWSASAGDRTPGRSLRSSGARFC